MSSREFDPCHEGPPAGGSGSREDPTSGLLQLISRAVLGAIIEDWTAQSLDLYRSTGQGLLVRGLPDDSIPPGSALERQLVQQLAGDGHPLDELSYSFRNFLALVVSGTRVLEDETAFWRLAWVSRGEVADPVFVLNDGAR
jgi:hypothetical protein